MISSIKKSYKKNKSLIQKTAAMTFVFCVIMSVMSCRGASDRYIRDRVVKLVSPSGSCSGQQVVAASGQDYILSAGHCKVLEVDGSITVITEDGRAMNRRVIAEDPKSDLLLLEGIPNLYGLNIAGSLSKYEQIRTFTHGKGYDTYVTRGIVVQDFESQIIVGPGAECPSMPKFQKVDIETIFGNVSACVLDVQETVTTASIVPGSSGGAIVNSDGDLVGVASATDGHFGFIVRLSDIRSFLANY